MENKVSYFRLKTSCTELEEAIWEVPENSPKYAKFSFFEFASRSGAKKVLIFEFSSQIDAKKVATLRERVLFGAENPAQQSREIFT